MSEGRTSEWFRLREIEKFLYNQQHEVQEANRLARMRRLPQTDQDQTSQALLVALDRWEAYVARREIPEELKNWDETGFAPEKSRCNGANN
jgi:hypothetical protein